MDAAELRARLRTDLTAAMKARESDTVAALRTTLAAIDNAEAVATADGAPAVAGEHVAGATAGVGSTEATRRELSLDDVRTVIRAQVDERVAEAAGYERHGRTDAAERLEREAAALAPYLDA